MIEQFVWTQKLHHREIRVVYPLIYKGVAYPEYGIDSSTGRVWSKKRGFWTPRAESVSGKSPYPKLCIRDDFGRSKNIMVHVAAHETLNPITPTPPGVTKKEWKVTPQSVKNLMRDLWQVNHIDHNHLNFHPDNLEWVTADENVEAYQIFREAA